MYALICDEFEPTRRKKRIISVHKTRMAAEKAQMKMPHKLHQEGSECYTRIVWAYHPIHKGKTITLSLIHISEPTRHTSQSRLASSG